MSSLHFKDRKPQFLITYRCPHCGMDSGRTELDQPPQCFTCDAREGLVEVKRERLTLEVLASRMQRSVDRMMENLQKAHEALQREGAGTPEEETMLLQAMAEGQDFQQKVQALAKKMVRKRERKAKV